jgi:hypothetical protein
MKGAVAAAWEPHPQPVFPDEKAMRYDSLGFPIPAEYEPAAFADRDAELVVAVDRERQPAPRGGSGGPRADRAHPWKRWLLLAVLLGGILPAVAGPQLLPLVREGVVQWALDEATACEARDDIGGAVDALGWAVRWHGDDVGLLCMRASLRLQNRDARGALEDLDHAVALAPTTVAPWRLRALVHVVFDDADAAVADAEMVTKLSAPGDPDALNHRAYIRAVLGRDLPEALVDIDRALEGDEGPAPEMLDTRGFILHLLGRHREAVDLLTEAITGMQQQRRKLGLLAGRADPASLACRLRAVDQGLAVMLHHRGQACRAIGLNEQAEQDFRQAERKGFDPSRGIF